MYFANLKGSLPIPQALGRGLDAPTQPASPDPLVRRAMSQQLSLDEPETELKPGRIAAEEFSEPGGDDAAKGVPVFVMMPLDTVPFLLL